MENSVCVFSYHWCTAETEGTEVIGIYRDFQKASAAMRAYMTALRDTVKDEYEHFDADFDNDDNDYVSFGFYGEGFGTDHVWSGRIDIVEVQE